MMKKELILDDQNDSDILDPSFTNAIIDAEPKQVASHVRAVGFTYRSDSSPSPSNLSLKQRSQSHSQSPSHRQPFQRSQSPLPIPDTAAPLSTSTIPKKKPPPDRKSITPPQLRPDIKLKPELMINVDPPISILNYMKKSNLLPNIKYDTTVIQNLLKDSEVAKAVNFELGENHLITKSLTDLKQSSLKQFQSLNQYKYGISPMMKRELLQKTIVDEKLKTLIKFDRTMMTWSPTVLSPSSSSPPFPNMTNTTSGDLNHRHSGFFLDQSLVSANHHILFNPNHNDSLDNPATTDNPHPSLASSAPIPIIKHHHPLLNGQMRPISFIPSNPVNVKKITESIRQSSAPAKSSTTDTAKMIGTSIDPDKKTITIRERPQRSSNPKKSPQASLSPSPGSVFSPPASAVLNGRPSEESPNRNTSPNLMGIRMKTPESVLFSDSNVQTPLYTPETFRRPKPREDLEVDGGGGGGGGGSVPSGYSTDPMVYQTEKWLETMEGVPPIDKSISFDEEGHPKHLSLNTSVVMNDDLSSVSSKGNLSIVSKIPKTPSTPGGKNRKKFGEAVEQLIRPVQSFHEKQLLKQFKKQHLKQDYETHLHVRAELQHDSIIEKHSNELILDARKQTQSSTEFSTPAVDTSNPHAMTSSQRSKEKNKLHCVNCLQKQAELWCPQCLQAYCQPCWNKVNHHTALNMIPITTLDGFEFPLRPSSYAGTTARKKSVRIPPNPATSHQSKSPKGKKPKEVDTKAQGISTAPSPKSYSKSILFASYQSEEELDNVFHAVEDIVDPRVGTQHKPATVPRDETAVLEYQDYPLAPVYLDGKGQVHSFRERLPSTATSPFSPPTSPFHPQSLTKVIVRTLSPPISYHAKLLPTNQAAKRHYDPQFKSSVKPIFRYVSPSEYSEEIQKLTQSTAHVAGETTEGGKNRINRDEKMQRLVNKSSNEKEITIRRDPYKFRKRPKVAFAVGGGNSMSIAFSSKPPASSIPMKGITKELLPIDWKEGLFSTKEIATTNPTKDRFPITTMADSSRKKATPSTASLKEIKPKEVNIFNGVAVYTVDYKK